MKKWLVVLVLCVIAFSLILGVTSLGQKVPSPFQYNSPSEYQKATGRGITKFNEAPILAELVKQGKLPPVEKRLPKEPIVIVPVEEVGQYGGRANVISTSPMGYNDSEALSPLEGLFKVSPDASSVVPNIAKGYEFSGDGKTLTLYLREGIKWSDGAPFTADDIMFWWEDVILNDELTPVKPATWSPGGKLMEMNKVDDYTIRMQFAIPYPVATMYLAHSSGVVGSFYIPKHYLKNYHPRYTPIEKLNEQAKKEGFDSWYRLFQKHSDFYGSSGMKVDPGAPTLNSFVLTKRGTDFIALERNPYYWKVDIAGNQLPYIDEIFVSIVQNIEVMNVRVIGGEVDIAQLHTSMDNYTLYVKNKEKGDYRVLLWPSMLGSDVAYQCNLTYTEDPVLRDIFRDVRFRRALSLAMNRDEINQLLYHGMGTPRQVTVVPQSPYYEESFAKAYIEYDPERANSLLDEMGLKRGPDGYRLRPDGKRLEIVLEYWPGETPKGPTTELVLKHWDDIGIKIAAKPEDESLIITRTSANLIQMGLWHGDRCAFLFPIEPFYWVPMNAGKEVPWAIQWARWYRSGGKSGEEPPPEMKRLLQLWERMRMTVDEEERIRLGKEILKSNAENLWTIGTVGLVPHPVIVKNRLRNVPENGMWGWDQRRFSSYLPEQFFLKQK
ncbi:MAG: ABC transporter substrate-binding protein [bacterium]